MIIHQVSKLKKSLDELTQTPILITWVLTSILDIAVIVLLEQVKINLKKLWMLLVHQAKKLNILKNANRKHD
jgi:hypothetical protein